MKITRMTTYQVPPRWLFLKIETDDGITGWGEPVVEGRAATVRAAVAELSDYLIGTDPSRIEDHWQVMYRGGFYRGGPVLMSAIAGIDQALWDIKGKAAGLPVHQLLGGPCRDRIRVYSWVGGDRPQDALDQARENVALGFTALKMNATAEMQIVDSHAAIDRAVAGIAAMREAVGPDVGLAVDFHGRVQRPMARVLLRELDPLRLLFVEEPVLPDQIDALPALTAGLATPIALGERLYSRWDFRPVLEGRAVDIVQPDLSHAGGITECRKIAAMAEAYDVALAPHCPLGPIALAASLQVDAVAHNAFIQEQSLGIHYNAAADILDYLVDASVFDYGDGMVAIPTAPGLGIEVDETAVARAAETGHAWRNPVWRHRDGSVAEW
ncbi:galactonate dehydratase [Palleronia rufa]|uniref:galactonate dehydratase n=1 Tax=Palleronia rufa TaxID=1530186 RepID=UPI0005648BF4|nr:galactonate dehydratase [Palleronia rufa]